MRSSLLAVAVLFCAPNPTHAAVTIFQDEALFTADLATPSDFGAVGADFHGANDITGLVSQATSPVPINGSNYGFTFTEGVFDTSLGGLAASATAAPTVGAIDVSGSKFDYEAGSVAQGGAAIPAWGYDTDRTASNSANTVALFDFTLSATRVFSFSLSAADFEGGNGWSNVVAAYRADGTLIGEISFDYPAPAYGDGTVEFTGFGADEALGYVAFFVGEPDATGFGHRESIAVGDFKLGSSRLNSVPEPTLAVPVLLGVTLLRRRAAVRNV